MSHDLSPDLETTIRSAGYACLKDVGTSSNALLNLLGRLGHPRSGTFWGELQMVTYKPGTQAADSVAESDQILPAHSDGSFESNPPELLLLQCVQPDLEGFGESRIVPVENLVTSLSAESLDLLRQPIYYFSKREQSGTAEATAPVLWSLPDGRDAIRYRRDEKYQIAARTDDAMNALDELTALIIEHGDILPAPLGAGDILVLDNRRCLHSRTALSGKVIRELRTAWGDYNDPGTAR